MKRFTSLRSTMVSMNIENIDTDQVIPARFLKVIDRKGLGRHLFCDWRYDEAGEPIADFVLNRDASQGAQVLVAGANFGCGSSREHAPWALVDWGFRVVIAPSFADIFENNALQNGLLPVCLDDAAHANLVVQAKPGNEVHIDLPAQIVTLPDGSHASFAVDPFAKHCLLEGLDRLGYLQSFEREIAEYERA